MNEEIKDKVLAGFERIAFGDVRDPVRLLFCEEITPGELARMDLFSIAEIKRPKGGGMEIKFFDRIRALQCMRELSGGETSAAGFYRALEEGAQALREEEAGESP